MDAKVALDRLVAAAESLQRETARLVRDVNTLNIRIIADDSEREWVEPIAAAPRLRAITIVEALSNFEESRLNIRNCEYELAAIRARIDDIAANEAAREDMRQYLKRD